jgi:hypothetical protein
MSKVRILKDVSNVTTIYAKSNVESVRDQVTIGIGDEVRQSNMELGNMVCA